MKNLITGLTFLAVVLMSTLFTNNSYAQATSHQTPTLESINLPFNIDGNVERQSNSYGDWTSGGLSTGTDSGSVLTPSGAVRAGMPLTYHTVDVWNTNGSDDMFDGGNKSSDDPTTWGWKYGKVLAKNEVNNANLHISKDVSTGDLWAIMAGDRYSTTGTAWMDFEFYQNRITAHQPVSGGVSGHFQTNGPDCGRTVGDLLVTVEYTNGGSVDSIYFYRWSADTTGSTPCGYHWVAFTIPSGNAFGYSNDTAAAVPYGAFGQNSYNNLQFVETAINLSSVIDASVVTADPCTGLFFESVFVKTKSSAATTADLKDMIAPIQLDLNVGKADIEYGLVCSPGSYFPTNYGPSSTNGGTYSLLAPVTNVSINSSTGELTIGTGVTGPVSVIYSYTPRASCTQDDTTELFFGNTIAGHLFNDGDGLCGDATVDGTGFNNPDATQMYAVLLDHNNIVIDIETVASDGSYDFGCYKNDNYTIVMTTTQPTIGDNGAAATLPTNWVYTGENEGTTAGNDGTVNGQLPVYLNSADITEANFGIEKQPLPTPQTFFINDELYLDYEVIVGSAVDTASTPQVDPGLQADDNEEGNDFAFTDVIITQLPQADSFEMWYNGTQITTVPYDISSFVANNLKIIVKCSACLEVTFYYNVLDAACEEGYQTAGYSYSWANPAVPVEFVDVTARAIGPNAVRVNWTTASEINNELFEIERMVNGEFEKVGEVAGAGNSETILNYEFIDMNTPAAERLYYRIKQIDYDGNFDYSNVAVVNMLPMGELVVYPNPTQGAFTVKADDRHEELNVELYDMSGMLIDSWNGIGECNANTQGLKPGIYNLRVMTLNGAQNLLLQID